MHGEKALAEKQYPIAQEDFTLLLHMGVRTAPVYSNLGVVYIHSGKPDEAVRMLESAEKLAPTVAGIRLNLGLAYFRQREFKQAARYFGEVLAMSPDHVQARYLQGICGFMTDNFQVAVDSFQPIYERESNDLEYLFMLGVSLGMLHQAEKSQQVFAALVAAGGDTLHLHLLLGKAYLALGAYQEADRELTLATRDKALPYAHYYRGVLAQEQNQMDRAAEQFQEEVVLTPTNPWAFKELAMIEVEQGDTKSATRLLRRGIKNNPDAPELYAALGRVYLQSGDARNALLVLKQAAALDPQNGTYHFQLARAYRAAGRHAKAEEEMNQTRALATGGTSGQMELLSRGAAALTVP